MRILYTLLFLAIVQTNALAFNWNGLADADEHAATTWVVDTNFVNAPDTVLLQITDCAATAPLCVDLPTDDVSNFTLWANGAFYSLGLDQCNIDTTHRYSYANLTTSGPYSLDSWFINGIPQSQTSFNTIDELVAYMNTVDPLGNWVHDPVNQLIEGGVESNVYSDMVISENASQVVFGVTQSFTALGTSLNFPEGWTEFVLQENTTQLTDTFHVNVICTPHDTINLTLLISDSSVECLDFSELAGDVDTVFNACPTNSGTAVDFFLVNDDSCVVVTTIAGGTDAACFVACDTFGFCDTTTFIVNVNVPGTPGTQTFADTLFLGDGDLFCVNTGVLPGVPDTIFNICPGSGGQSSVFNLDQNTFCVSYNSLAEGIDTACIVVCDDMGVCDTTVMSITVLTLGLDYFYDTLFFNTDELYCNFDLSELPGNLVNMTNGCPGSSGQFVDFTVDAVNNCVAYDALSAGKDTACIYLTDDLGNQDTLMMVVCVLAPQPSVVIDTIRLGLSAEHCLDVSELGGTVSNNIQFCDPLDLDVVSVDPDNGALCIDITGMALGTDTFCVYICDDLSVCDTTYFYINVNDEEVITPPVANADVDTAFQNTLLVTHVCANDEVPGNDPTSFFVLAIDEGGLGPQNGATFANPGDCTIDYIPDNNFCGATDSYTYVICNAAGCDTTSVEIYVACPATNLAFYDGFSPNQDGVNDTFRIEGIEGLPDNTLYVFNRWGNQVFKIDGYTNQPGWDGTWEGVQLPDGVYYYLLDHGDGEKSSGWVVLSR